VLNETLIDNSIFVGDFVLSNHENIGDRLATTTGNSGFVRKATGSSDGFVAHYEEDRMKQTLSSKKTERKKKTEWKQTLLQ
jgi:hypothetical protein